GRNRVAAAALRTKNCFRHSTRNIDRKPAVLQTKFGLLAAYQRILTAASSLIFIDSDPQLSSDLFGENLIRGVNRKFDLFHGVIKMRREADSGIGPPVHQHLALEK